MAISVEQLRCRSCGGGDLTLTEETRFSCYKCRHCKNLWIPTIAEIENDASWHRDVGEAFDAYKERAFAEAKRKFKQLHKQKRTQSGRRQIDDVVADKYHRNQFVVLFVRECTNRFRVFLSQRRKTFQFNAVRARKSRFRSRKKAGKQNEYDDYDS